MEERIAFLERTVKALCEIIRCTSDANYYCDTKDCPEKLFGKPCPLENIDLFLEWGNLEMSNEDNLKIGGSE